MIASEFDDSITQSDVVKVSLCFFFFFFSHLC